MAYIGQSPSIGNFQVCDAISVVNGQAAYTMQVSSVNVVPETANHMLVSLNGILQRPGSSFTVSGSTITFASNLVTGDVINFIHILGSVLDLGVPSDATVTDAKTNFVSTSSAAGLQIKGDGTTAGALQLNCEQNSHGIKLQSPAHSSSQSYTLKFPTGNVTADRFLKVSSVSGSGTTGIGQLSFAEAGGGANTLISTSTVSSPASEIIVSSGIDSTYKIYMIDIINMHPGTDNSSFRMQFRQGGSTISSSIYDYGFQHVASSSTNTHNYTDNDPQINMANNINADATSGLSGRIFLYEPSNTTYDTRIQWNITFELNGDYQCHSSGSGRIESTTAVDGFRLFMGSGNIDLCTAVKLYGVT